jgi:hypothetical protein
MKKLIWTKERLKEGFERFISENGHLPTAPEVDQTNYLPSSRAIQKRFGGLQKLRADLDYEDVHFGRRSFRSAIASNVNRRGRSSEIELEFALTKIFGEVFVHTEKIYGSGKNRVDFYVYSPDDNFGADVFYPNTFRSLQSNLNIKMMKYQDFPCDLYFVVANNDIDQTSLDLFVSTKKNPLSDNMKLLTLETFLRLVQKMKVYHDPLQRTDI